MAFPTPLMFLLPLAIAASNAVPRFNVEPSCKGGLDSPGLNERYGRCISQGERHHQKLEGAWSSWPAGDRTQYTDTAKMGAPSYVELLACLEQQQHTTKMKFKFRISPVPGRWPLFHFVMAGFVPAIPIRRAQRVPQRSPGESPAMTSKNKPRSRRSIRFKSQTATRPRSRDAIEASELEVRGDGAPGSAGPFLVCRALSPLGRLSAHRRAAFIRCRAALCFTRFPNAEKRRSASSWQGSLVTPGGAPAPPECELASLAHRSRPGRDRQ